MNTFTSATAQVIVAIVPIVGIVFGGIIIFFYLLWHHREVSLQIKTGTYKPSTFDVKLFSLLAGSLLTGLGTVLTLVLFFIDGVRYTLLGGLVPFAIGVSLLIFNKFVD